MDTFNAAGSGRRGITNPVFNRKTFAWRSILDAQHEQKKELPPVPVAASGGHVTWRVEGPVAYHANQAKEANPQKAYVGPAAVPQEKVAAATGKPLAVASQ
mmetsp:Transcript_49326/g.127233  ORF Transcript_49326/g.127233 Transcript_49326/m.127233 type:complete len:101 (+) Transcript_49326:81-383(+)